MVEHLGGGGDRDPVALRPLPEPGFFGNVAVGPVSGDEDVEALAERFPEEMRRPVGRNFLPEGGGAAAPERVESLGARGDLLPGNSGGPLAGGRSCGFRFPLLFLSGFLLGEVPIRISRRDDPGTPEQPRVRSRHRFR